MLSFGFRASTVARAGSARVRGRVRPDSSGDRVARLLPESVVPVGTECAQRSQQAKYGCLATGRVTTHEPTALSTAPRARCQFNSMRTTEPAPGPNTVPVVT